MRWKAASAKAARQSFCTTCRPCWSSRTTGCVRRSTVRSSRNEVTPGRSTSSVTGKKSSPGTSSRSVTRLAPVPSSSDFRIDRVRVKIARDYRRSNGGRRRRGTAATSPTSSPAQRKPLARPIAYCMFSAVAKILEEGAPLVRNASVAATEVIRQAILDGRLEPGRRLKEEELARELGISRTPVREALLILQSEGLIETTPNRGAVVVTHDADDLIDLYQLRALLEGHAARQAAARISDEEIGLLRESCDRFDRIAAEDIRELVKENLLFHRAIHAAAGSARLSGMLRRVIELPLVYKSYVWYSPDQKRISAHYHRQITNALSVRDAERAELVMREHVFEARDLLVANVRDRAETP